jgi:hypothetical protein
MINAMRVDLHLSHIGKVEHRNNNNEMIIHEKNNKQLDRWGI